MKKLQQKRLAWILVFVMIFAMIGTSPISQAAEPIKLDASDLAEQTLLTTTAFGSFTITASSDKTVVIASDDKIADDGTVFTKRIKMGGSGNADYRSIHFNLATKGTVKVYGMSSGSDAREIGVFALDGTLIDKMTAGTSLSMGEFTLDPGDYYVAGLANVNFNGITILPINEPVVSTLNISDMALEEIATPKTVDIFTILGTDAEKLVIDSAPRAATDGTAFTLRLKLGGAGNAVKRSVHFTVGGDSTVKVYAMSSTTSADRKLDLYHLDGTLVGQMDAFGTSLADHTFEIPSGDYYLASPSSGVNIYKIEVTTGEVAPVVRAPWADFQAPVIDAVTQEEGNLVVAFDLLTDIDGADKAEVVMYDQGATEIKRVLVGKSGDLSKRATFPIAASGTYSFVVEALRNDEDTVKASASVTADFLLPLSKPIIRAFNNGGGSVTVKWFEVAEATSYDVLFKKSTDSDYNLATNVSGLEATVLNLELGTAYDLIVKALRGPDEMSSDVLAKTIKDQKEREWNFTYFGQSVSSSRNTFEMVDEEAFTFKLNSCTIKADGITIDGKGGKFTNFHDGISYYYTEVDPANENFVLKATFTVDYMNSTPDGQEGFGLLAMDTIGEYGKSSVNHYTNSAGVLATKFEETINEVKYTGKDVLGTRFITGITQEVFAAGDSAITSNAKSVSKAFAYGDDQLIQTGASYTLVLKKTNTGYHASLDGGEERILYGVDKLLQLDPNHLYVGFAVARGCNVTVSNVSFTTTDPANDPPALEEPKELVSYTKKIDSPTTSGKKDYDFVYVSDVPGTLTIKDSKGTMLADEVTITADVDYTKALTLSEGLNSYQVIFTPQADFIPGDNQVLDSYEPVTLSHQVTYRRFDGEDIYVTPTGLSSALGTKTSPVDIHTALAYAKAGQVIRLSGGLYKLSKPLTVSRGIDGSQDKMIYLSAKADARAIFDFENAGGGMQLWGDYWFLENIDITKTPGNIKGLQVAGSNNIISRINAYENGDTGIQISGTGAETIAKWPANNLVINCTSYDNMDPGMNNADGFAAKITVADGNVFRGCMAYNNLDDGWDLFAKIESGPIGAVTIENCLAFKNGTLTNGVGDGDGNGFKLGGDGIAVPHKLINSIAYDNNNDGVTSNSNPAVIIENVTSYGNKGRNITLYGKGTGDRAFVMTHTLSMNGTTPDNISEMPSLASVSNYLDLGAGTKNSDGTTLLSGIFVTTDTTILPTRLADGSINTQDLLTLNGSEPQGLGAHLSLTPLGLSVPAEKVVTPPSSQTTPEETKKDEGETKEVEILPESVPEVVLVAMQAKNHWAEQAVVLVVSKNIIRPDEEVDITKEAEKGQVLTYLFRTVMPTSSDETDLLGQAINKGWIKGDGQGQYDMDKELNRETAMVILARILRERGDIVLKEVDMTLYDDFGTVSAWAREDVMYVVQAGLIKGRSASTLCPKDKMTMAEIIIVINNLLGIIE